MNYSLSLMKAWLPQNTFGHAGYGHRHLLPADYLRAEKLSKKALKHVQKSGMPALWLRLFGFWSVVVVASDFRCGFKALLHDLVAFNEISKSCHETL